MHLEWNSVEVDISIWRLSEAPAALRDAFFIFPEDGEDGWVAKLSSSLMETIDPTLETALFGLFQSPILARARLADGGVALLFAP